MLVHAEPYALVAALVALLTALWMLVRNSSRRRAAEMRWRGLLDGTAEGVAVISAGGLHLDVNEAYAGMIGRTVEECRNLPLVSAIHPDERKRISDVVDRRARGERATPTAFETALCGPDGGRVEVAVAVHEFPERPGSWVIVVRDVTAETEQRSRLRRERNLLGRIFSVVQDGIALIDKSMRVRFVNRKLHEMSRRSLGEPCHEVLYERSEVCPWCPWKRVMDGETVTVEAVSRGVPVEATLAPFPNPDGTTSVLEVLHDVSASVAAENSRKESVTRVSILLEAADLLHSASNEQAVAASLVDIARRVIDESDVAVYEYDEARDEVRSVAASALTGLAGRRLRRDRVRTEDDPLIGRAVHLSRPEVVPDLSTAAPTLAGRYRQWGYSGAAAYPLIGRIGVLGVVLILRRAYDWPQPERFDLLSGVIAYATSALEQTKVFAGTGRRARDFTMVRLLSHELAALPSGEEVAERLTRWALRFAEPMLAAVVAKEDDGIVVRAVSGRNAEMASAFSRVQFPADGAVAEAMADGRTLVADDASCVPAVDTPRPVESVLLIPFPDDDGGRKALLILSDFEPTALAEARPALEAAVEIAASATTARASHDQSVERSLAETRPRDSLDAVARLLAVNLREPLASIRGYVHALADRLPGTEVAEIVASLERAVDSVDRLGRDLSALVALEREEAARGIVDLAGVMRDLRVEFSPRYKDAGVDLVLPEETPKVIAAREHVHLVLSEFLSNALLYLGDAPSPRVTVSALTMGDTVRVEVKDTGVGIPPSAWERVFEPFVREETVPGVAGTGVGLSAARKAARASGGEVGATSPRTEADDGELYPGSTFWVVFPSAEPRVTWEAETADPAQAEA